MIVRSLVALIKRLDRFARKNVRARFGGRRRGRGGKKFDPKLRKLYADMR